MTEVEELRKLIEHYKNMIDAGECSPYGLMRAQSALAYYTLKLKGLTDEHYN